MKSKIFKKTIIALVVILTTSISAYAQQYEVYDGKEFSLMFVVKNNVAEDVKFAVKGDTEWSDFEVIETNNWNGNGNNKNCLFTFYVIDEELDGYQIDYYENNHIWVFEIDHDLKQIGEGWKLTLR